MLSLLTPLIAGLFVIVGVGVFAGVAIKIYKNVKKGAAAQGVDLTDGLQMSEVRIFAALLQKELADSAELEAIATIKRVIDKVAAQRNVTKKPVE